MGSQAGNHFGFSDETEARETTPSEGVSWEGQVKYQYKKGSLI